MSTPYKSTPVFNEQTLPAALRNNHSTKAGIWGKLRILSGSLMYTIADPYSEQHLSAGEYAMIQPEQLHKVTPLGAVQMQVEFYREHPHEQE